MTTDKDLTTIEREGSRIIELGRQAPDRNVPQYPTWSMTDLVLHVAGVHGRTATVCRTLAQEQLSRPRLPDGADPFEWAAEQLSDMLEALAAANPGAAVWSFVDDRTIGFWVRRMVIETGVHRWDAESAVGGPEPLLDRVAEHGLDEFALAYLPRLGDLPGVELHATDLGRSWRLGTGDPQSVVEATASELYLRLMSRPGAALPAAWEAAVDALAPPPN